MQQPTPERSILILNYEYPPLGGGAANATYYLLRELAKQHEFSIELVTSSTDSFKIEQLAPHVRVHKLDIGKSGNIHYQSMKDLLMYAWKAYWYSKKLIRKHPIDGIHAFFGIPCGLVALLLRRQYIVSLRGSDVPFYNERFALLDKMLFARLSKHIWRKATAVIANSQQLKELALQTAPQQEIAVVYNGVDTEEFTPPSLRSTNELTLISTSRLIARKGIHLLVDATIELLNQGNELRLIIVGSGDMEDELRKRVIESGHTKKIEFLGAVDHSTLPLWYKKADVFVLPSQNEGMSNSMLEAMASGLAIIATNTGGTQELLTAGNSITIEQPTADGIAKAIQAMLHAPERLPAMQEASRTKAIQLSWSAMAEAYLEAYSHFPDTTGIQAIDRGNYKNNIVFLDKTGLLSATESILEIGSGNGHMVHYLTEKGYNVTGTEIRSSYIQNAREQFGIELKQMDGESIGFEDESFDHILSFDVLEHIPDTDTHLQDVRRVLKPGGYYLLQTPNKWTNIPFEVLKHKSFTKYKEYHCALHTRAQLKKRFENNGFSISFIDVPIVTPYFKKKLHSQFGWLSKPLLLLCNPDRLPKGLKTNFYVVAQKK